MAFAASAPGRNVKALSREAVWWIDANAARQFGGPAPDLPTATAALHRSAASLGATLTPDDIAIARASAAVIRLDAMIEAMRRDGALAEFNARYKRGRAAAAIEGKGFMGYGVAMARLKAALIPHLKGRGHQLTRPV